jgi:hypothetical protein
MDNINTGPLRRLTFCDTGTQLTRMSMEIFQRYLASDLGAKRLKEIAKDDDIMDMLATKFLEANEYSGLWLLFLLQIGGTEEELQQVQELYDALYIAKKIPTGLRVTHKTLGHFPLNNSLIDECKEVSDESRRILLGMMDDYCQFKQNKVDLNSPRIRFIIATMTNPNCDTLQRFLTSRLIAFLVGISVNIKAEYDVTITNETKDKGNGGPGRNQIALDFLDLVFDSFLNAIKQLDETKLQLRVLHRDLFMKTELESDRVHEYKILLFDASGMDDEESLPMSINHYLKDNEELRITYGKMNKAKEALISLRVRYNKKLINCTHLVPNIRFLVALIIHMLGVVLPAHICVQTEIQSKDDFILYEKVHDMMASIPWETSMREFFGIEREIYGAVYTRLLATLACLLFPDLQETLSADNYFMEADEDTVYEERQTYHRVVTAPSIVRKAMNDLVNPNVPWKTSEELFPAPEEWLEKSTLHRPIRHCRLDTRISTSLVYWAGNNNPFVQDRLCKWKCHISDKADSPYMWKQLVVRSDKSETNIPFDHDDGSNPHILREYKEQYDELADEATFDFMMTENNRAEEMELEITLQVHNRLKFCSDFRVSTFYGNYFAKNLFYVIMCQSQFGFEGRGMHSLRVSHPLNIVLQLSTHICNSAQFVAKTLFEEHEVHIKALLKVIVDSSKRLTKYEDNFLLNVSIQLLGNIIQGPCPVHRNPSIAPPFKDMTLEPSFHQGCDVLRQYYHKETKEVLNFASNLVFHANIEYLCPIGALPAPAITCALHLITNLIQVFSAEEVTDALCDACVDNFDTNYWQLAVLSDYERFEMEEDERANREADQDDPAVQKRIYAKKNEKRQSYANFMFFSIEGGLYSLANHYIKEGGWRLNKDVLALFWSDLEPLSNEYRCLVLELVNSLSFYQPDLVLLMIKRTNFLAGIMLDNLSQLMQNSDLPTMIELQQQPRYFNLNQKLLQMRIGEQILRLSTHIVNSGRVKGRIKHSSEFNEFILYFALAENGISLDVATKMLTYASVTLREISLSHSMSMSNDTKVENQVSSVHATKLPSKTPEPALQRIGSAWDEYTEYCLHTHLRDSVLFVIDFLHNLCVGRLELQTKIQHKCSTLFDGLMPLMAKNMFFSDSTTLVSSRLFPSDSYSHFHVGTARRIAMLLSVLTNRHEGCTDLVQTSGCMAALMSGLNDCMDDTQPLDKFVQKEWSECITRTIENIVARNLDAWTYCQSVSGINGLFSLVFLGNNTIKKLVVTTMLDFVTGEKGAMAYVDELVVHNAVNNLRIIIDVPDDDDLVNLTLTLIKLVVISSKAFRVQAFDPEQKTFFESLTMRLTTPHQEIQANVCDIFNYFCADDPDALRGVLLKYNAMKHILKLASGLDYQGTPEENRKNQVLAKAAATTVANLTLSDESEFLVGSAPLRPTLAKSGILPSLRRV